MAHYYTNDDVLSEEKQIEFFYKEHQIPLITDHGVFSRNRVDYGSRVLLDTISIDDAKSLLDVGCGYGVMGIALKVANENLETVDMIDVNQRAISLANKNIKCNNLSGIVAYESNIYESVDKTFDIIISNPPIRAGKEVVSAIISEAIDHLNDNGRLIIVIQKKQGAPSAKKLMESIYKQVKILNRDKGYYILSATK